MKIRRLKPTIVHTAEEKQIIFENIQPDFELYKIKKIHAAELIARMCLYERQLVVPQWTMSAEAPVIEELRRHGWRGLPAIVRNGLLLWHDQNWAIPVVHHKPSPLELLQAQSQGQRPLTFFDQKQTFIEFFEEIHSAIGLIIHDVIHAWRFFTDFEAQVRLSQFYLSLYRPLVAKFPQKEFIERLDYIVADMNTHTEHSLMTLRALLLDTIRPQDDLSLGELLTEFSIGNLPAGLSHAGKLTAKSHLAEL